MARKILISSNPSFFRTGFGKNSRVLLSHLYSQKLADGSKKWECIELAQGIREGDPRLKALPWKAVGGIPKDDSYLTGQPRDQNGNYDPNLSRMVAYGSARFEEVLKEEKPDIFLNIEDGWAHNTLRSYSNRPYLPLWETEWWDKFNTIIQTPLDSLPLFAPIVENANRIKHLFVKSSFAEKELHRLGHKHVGLWPCLMDAKDYRVFSEEEKKKNRQKYGISEDTVIFSMVARNQGRKLFVILLEGFKLFKEKNPESKAKVLLVTSISEGWNLKDAIKELEINPEDVIVPYVCHSCGETVLRSIGETEENCPKCNGVKTLKTISVEKGIEEKELVELYNLTDGYLQCANSGGFENPLLESALSGCFTAVPNYSFGEMFYDSGFVYGLDFTFSREMGTNFKKANPHPESICSFMEEVYKNPEESKEKGLKFREWAMKTIHPSITLKKIEDYLDSLPISSYDFDFQTEFPDPNAKFSNASDENEFIKETYKNFFGQNLTEEDKNFRDMKSHLESGASREDIFRQCKQISERTLAERNKTFDPSKFFKDNNKKRILWEMAGDYGDSLLSLAPLEGLRNLYPEEEWDIYISCLPQYKEVYEHLPFIAGFIPFYGVQQFEMWEGSRNHQKYVDVWISPARDQNYKHNGVGKNEFHPDFSLTSLSEFGKVSA